MSWQKAAVEAMCRTQYSGATWPDLVSETDRQLTRDEMTRALRAALPLIEVTPGMLDARRVRGSVVSDVKAMLSACAQEDT